MIADVPPVIVSGPPIPAIIREVERSGWPFELTDEVRLAIAQRSLTILRPRPTTISTLCRFPYDTPRGNCTIKTPRPGDTRPITITVRFRTWEDGSIRFTYVPRKRS